MRTPDPMAENQTDQTIIALTNGNADDRTRDHATAALLASVQKLIMKTEEIERSLWKPVDLDRIIDERHKLFCASCPVRTYVESLRLTVADPPPATPTPAPGPESESLLAQFLKNPLGVGVIVLCLGLLAGLIYLAAGPTGFRDITNAAHLTSERPSAQKSPCARYPGHDAWWKEQEKPK